MISWSYQLQEMFKKVTKKIEKQSLNYNTAFPPIIQDTPLDKWEMFGAQTPSNIVWWSNILPFGHLVWCCLIKMDRVWSCLIKFEGH